MNSIKKKTGRKTIPYRAADGTTYDGLYRKPDGRWRILATGEEFREADERLAIARFVRGQKPQNRGMTITLDDEHFPDDCAVTTEYEEDGDYHEIAIPPK